MTDDAISTATAGTTTSALTKPIAIFGVVALVLVVAGILLRVVMKIFTAGRRPITTDEYDFDDFDRIGDLAHELHEDQVVDDALSDYLKRPKIPTESDSKRRRPSQIGADRVDVTRAGDSAFHITDTISMRKHTRIDVKPCGSEPSDAEPQRESVSIDPKPDSIDDRNHYQERNARRQHGPVSETDAFRITDKISMRKHTRIDGKPSRSESSEADPQRESVSIDPKPDSIEDRHHYQERNGRRQHGSVTETEEFLRDLQSSLIGAASASPLQADAVGSSDRRGKDGPSHIGDEIREREDVLEQLRRDLDRLLQSPKVA